MIKIALHSMKGY